MGISDLLVENALADGHWGICRRRSKKFFLCVKRFRLVWGILCVINGTFVDCGTVETQDYYAPIRLCSNTVGTAQTLTVSGCTFTYSSGKTPANGADILLNADKVGTNDKGTISANVQSDATVKTGVNVTLN